MGLLVVPDKMGEMQVRAETEDMEESFQFMLHKQLLTNTLRVFILRSMEDAEEVEVSLAIQVQEVLGVQLEIPLRQTLVQFVVLDRELRD